MLDSNRIKTKHMKARQKQRGISDEVIDLLCAFGRSSYNRGCWITDCDSRAIERIYRERPAVPASVVDKASRCYLIEIDGVDVTVAYKRKGWGKRFSSGRPHRFTQPKVVH